MAAALAAAMLVFVALPVDAGPVGMEGSGRARGDYIAIGGEDARCFKTPCVAFALDNAHCYQFLCVAIAVFGDAQGDISASGANCATWGTACARAWLLSVASPDDPVAQGQNSATWASGAPDAAVATSGLDRDACASADAGCTPQTSWISSCLTASTLCSTHYGPRTGDCLAGQPACAGATGGALVGCHDGDPACLTWFGVAPHRCRVDAYLLGLPEASADPLGQVASASRLVAQCTSESDLDDRRQEASADYALLVRPSTDAAGPWIRFVGRGLSDNGISPCGASRDAIIGWCGPSL